jgi:hypothetical protein
MEGALYEVVSIRQSGRCRHQSDDRPGLTFSPSRDPMKPAPARRCARPVSACSMLDLRPEICSLDMGSMNMGPNV